MTSYFRNPEDGVYAKHEGNLVYIWDGHGEPSWTLMPQEVLDQGFETFTIGTEAEFLAKVKLCESSC